MSREFENQSFVGCQDGEFCAPDISHDTWAKPKKSSSHRKHAHAQTSEHAVHRQSAEGDLVDAPINSIKVGDQEFVLYGGPGCSFHGHYDRDDGMGTVDSLAESAIKDGVRWFSVTPHNHKDSRNGVPPDDARGKDEAGKPNIVEDPKAYAQLRNDVARISAGRKTLAFYGQEMGTISKTNHLIVLEEPTLFVADLDGNTKEYPVRRFMDGLTQKQTAHGDPPVFHYKVTDGQAVIAEFERLKVEKNSILAHPKDGVPQEKGFPKGVSSVHYFMNCSANQYEWANKWGPYYTGIGGIQGMGLTNGPVEHMSPKSLKLQAVFGYNDTGIKLAVVFERDQHYGVAGGRPAGMAFLVRSEDKPALREALAERRSIVSTSYNDLHAVTIANDKYVMGNVINSADIDNLQFKVLIGGKLDRKATYNVKLWADTALGDLKTATVVDEKSVNGDELLRNHQEVQFDNVKYKPKNGNAFVMEIERAYPTDNGQTEVDVAAATTAVWVAPPDWKPGPVQGLKSVLRHRTKKH